MIRTPTLHNETEALEWLKKNEDALKQAARKFGYPVFVRTDHLSYKHGFLDYCYVESEESLIRKIYNVIEVGLCMMPPLPTKAIIIRKYIVPDYKFRAFNGLPIAPERRYFVRDGKVVKHMPYWPEDAIKFWTVPEPEGWREMLKEMNMETEEEIKLLTEYAEAIGSALGGYWSVDFMRGRDGKWYFIDMARGEVSWGGDT